jgi:hypothetical protein
MIFYILAGFAMIAVAFLVMIVIQLLRIEKTVAEITEVTGFTVKKTYQKEM